MYSLVLLGFALVCARQPHIVMIVADDYGWNDIGYHNTEGDVKTPNLDQLAADGIKLENYYVQPICSPTRSQLLSGKYQIHTGLQHSVIHPCVPSGLPLEDKTIADRLKSVGYETHAIGKWHIGFYKKEYTPIYRGFDSYFGYLLGSEDYYTHTRRANGFHGVDMHVNGTPTDLYKNQYSANIFSKEAQHVIQNHNKTQPLFLYMAYQSVHAPLQVPNSYLQQFKHIKDRKRRIYAGMVAAMDEGVGNITAQLKESGLWEDTLLIFTTDNGAQIFTGGSNAPLRGNKASYFEGGVRGVGFLSGPGLPIKSVENIELLHVSDWYPTLFNLAGGNSSSVDGLDGFDQWATIVRNSSSPRSEILHNIDGMRPRKGKSVSKIFDTSVQAALRLGNWKILTGNPGYDKWGPEPAEDTYQAVLTDDQNEVTWLAQVYRHITMIIGTFIQTIRSTIQEEQDTQNVYLFNIADDPEERIELSRKHPDVVNELLRRLAYYNSTQVPINYPPVDERCDPSLHGGFWVPWES